MRYFRIFPHLCLFVLLVVTVGWLWKNAWAISGAGLPIRLEPGASLPGRTLLGVESVSWDRAGGVLRLRGNDGGPMPSHEIPLAGWPRGGAAHIRFGGEAKDIVPGVENWQDGRVMVIWRDAKGRILQAHYGLLGAQGSGRFEREFLAVLNQPGQTSLFLQHAGKSGEFVIDRLEVSPVSLRGWVPWAIAGLLLAIAVWWAVLFRALTGKSGLIRPLGASCLALGAVWTIVLPGPWEPLRPLGGPFVIEHGTGTSGAPATPPAVGAPAPPPPETGAGMPALANPGESVHLPVPAALGDGWFWATYHWMKHKARALMHMGAFAGLTLAFLGILGSHRGWIPVAILGIASEAMQTLFGFGFEWEDAGDLSVNTLGIAIGLLVALWWKRRRAGRKNARAVTSPPCS